MKKLLILLGFVLILGRISAQDTSQVNGTQNRDGMIAIPEYMLTPEQKSELQRMRKIERIDEDLENYKKWAGAGKEVGIAINEGLKAVTEQTAAFAETKPGKFTMIIIAWKILGKDVVGFTEAVFGMIIGVPLLIAFMWVWLWHWKRTTSKRRVLVKEDGKKKEYQYEDTWFTEPRANKDESDKTVYVVIWWVSFCIGMIWITAGVIF